MPNKIQWRFTFNGHGLLFKFVMFGGGCKRACKSCQGRNDSQREGSAVARVVRDVFGKSDVKSGIISAVLERFATRD